MPSTLHIQQYTVHGTPIPNPPVMMMYKSEYQEFKNLELTHAAVFQGPS